MEENLSASEELVKSLQYTSASKQCGIETIEKLLQQNGRFSNIFIILSTKFSCNNSTIIH
jgi:hypothetical protein